MPTPEQIDKGTKHYDTEAEIARLKANELRMMGKDARARNLEMVAATYENIATDLRALRTGR